MNGSKKKNSVFGKIKNINANKKHALRRSNSFSEKTRTSFVLGTQLPDKKETFDDRLYSTLNTVLQSVDKDVSLKDPELLQDDAEQLHAVLLKMFDKHSSSAGIARENKSVSKDTVGGLFFQLFSGTLVDGAGMVDWIKFFDALRGNSRVALDMLKGEEVVDGGLLGEKYLKKLHKSSDKVVNLANEMMEKEKIEKAGKTEKEGPNAKSTGNGSVGCISRMIMGSNSLLKYCKIHNGGFLTMSKIECREILPSLGEVMLQSKELIDIMLNNKLITDLSLIRRRSTNFNILSDIQMDLERVCNRITDLKKELDAAINKQRSAKEKK